MARGRIIPDAEYIALIKQDMSNKEIAAHYNIVCSHSFKNRLNRIRVELKRVERQSLNPCTIGHMEPDEIKARYGERGENAETPPVSWSWGVRDELR